ncbi:tRNA pseudouridine synthase B [Candidatus Kinetoplastibacterium desouzaii TCC079E]|uniref:tRNA pseudouridine synthase B n=1 Tax=Candidatus Kinetoplastidibacterium desouzai TCC079E TaxID=1208919 RepID=M1M3Z6_9PROT|nr:tRNA pseudouridine(55) synthase TruB [Candidatus Kinetoplastibacterium desouzaii]AGF46960.1 tRNA pseudouridine synthase B [Candidatus Kinetoplastibacterium desouzaii TCC079E]
MPKKVFSDIDGLLLLDKPLGLSSNAALQKVRHLIKASKAGHAGTLDPFATGLLVCCIGKSTKSSSIFMEFPKSYIATIKFGEETDTGDLTGNIVFKSEKQIPIVEDDLIEVLNSFVGEIYQVPPMYSALKHNGVPLYKYARDGININREARKINIYSIKLLYIRGDCAGIEVFCSKGTYIRTLAEDIGRALKSFAHLVQLRRISVGPLFVNQAYTLDVLGSMDKPVDAVLDNIFLNHIKNKDSI